MWLAVVSHILHTVQSTWLFPPEADRMIFLVLLVVAGGTYLYLAASLSGVPQAKNPFWKALGAIAGLAVAGLLVGAILATVWPQGGQWIGVVASIGASIPLLRLLYGVASDEAMLLSLAAWVFAAAWAILYQSTAVLGT